MSFDIPEDNHNIKEFIDSITKNNYILTEDDNIWDCRYLIPDSQSNYGQSLKHDISTPLSDTINFIKKSLADLEQKYPNKLMPIIFGHMGDGNLHFNISKKENASFDLAEIKKEIKQIILQNVIELGGSFSSEHGVGLIHKEEFKKFYFTNQYNKLKLIKNTLDKNNIFNPNKILD
jgi:FAD/FMN-containing dehydrogenase